MITFPTVEERHSKVRKRVREFAENEIRPLAAKLDEMAEFSVFLTRKMGDMGFFGITIPKKYGGQELDTLSYIITVEELARVDGSQSATVASHNSLGLNPIYTFGTEAQKKDLLPLLCTGEKLWAFGLTEADAGSDSRGTKTTAIESNGNLIVNGEKIFITNCSSELSAGATVQVVTDEKNGEKELSVLLIKMESDGYFKEKIGDKMMWRAADTGKLVFVNCKVPKENILGKPGQGAKIMLETLDSGRLSIAAMGLGLAQGAFELAMDYAQKRQQFGKPIYKFQAISFKLAEMATKIELARNLLYTACWKKDTNQVFGKEAAMAKLYCSEIAKEVADESLQIHGAYGLFKSSEVERFYRDQRILQIGEGTSEILKLVISRHLGLK